MGRPSSDAYGHEVWDYFKYRTARAPIVLTMVSSGIRVGAWDFLHWEDIEPIQQDGELAAAKITVYRGETDQYFSFITPEAYRALKEYMDFRERSGEKISPSSPLMRDIWYGDRLGRRGHEAKRPVRIQAGGVKRLVEDAIYNARIRKPLEKGKRRHEFQALHGFRKFFKSTCEKNIKTLHAEILLGHNIGLNANYYRPKEEDLLTDYLKAIPSLTLLEQPVRETSKDLASMKKELADLKKRVKRWEDFTKRFSGMTNDQLTEVGNAIAQERAEQEKEV